MTVPQLNYRLDIDGLRGLSILLVLGFHGFPQLFPGGYIGVDVFFVISGYLITTQIYSQVKQGSFSIKSFYARRIRRIFPPLITVLIICGLYSYFCLSLDEFNSLFNHVVAGTTFTTNFLLWQESGYFDIRYSAVQNTCAWLVVIFVVIGLMALLVTRGIFLPQRLIHQVQLKKADQFDVQGVKVKSCAGFTMPNSLADRFCRVWESDEAKRTIVVWGDSMSNAWMPPFLTLAREYGFRVIQFSHAACPPILGVHRTGESFAKEWCNDATLQDEVVDAIQLEKPELVFLIARWNLYYHGHIKDDVLVEKSFITDEPRDATSLTAKIAFERGIQRTSKLLSKFSKVVVFKDTPVLKVPINIGLKRRPDSFEPSASEQQAFEADINRIIDGVVGRTTGVVAFDPTRRLCNINNCPGFVDGIPAYSDEAHITAQASLLFLSDIQSLVGIKK